MDAAEKTFPGAEHSEEIKVGPGDVFEGEAESGAENKTPLKPGEIFDPNASLREIIRTYTGKERDEKIAENRKKYVYQKEGIAKMQLELRQRIEQNHNISLEELFGEVGRFAKLYGMTASQAEGACHVIKEFDRKEGAIQQALLRFESEIGKIDAKKFFASAFGREPVGDIRVEAGLATIFLRCYDENDFIQAFKVSNLLTLDRLAPNFEEQVRAGIAGKLRYSLISELDDSIVVENYPAVLRAASKNGGAENEISERAEEISRSNFIHEEQHVFQSLFGELKPVTSEHYDAVLDAESLEERKVALRLYFKEMRPLMYAQAKDEMLAYAIEGEPLGVTARFEGLKKQFKPGGIYNCRGGLVEGKVRNLVEDLGVKYRTEIEAAADEVYGSAYESTIDAAMEAFLSLLGKDFSSKGPAEAANLLKMAKAQLSTEPLPSWRRLVSRLRDQAA